MCDWDFLLHTECNDLTAFQPERRGNLFEVSTLPQSDRPHSLNTYDQYKFESVYSFPSESNTFQFTFQPFLWEDLFVFPSGHGDRLMSGLLKGPILGGG